MSIKIGIVGAKGMVGSTMAVLLKGKYKVENAELVLFGRSDETIDGMVIHELTKENLQKIKPDFCLFAGGGDVSKVFAPIVASLGGVAIDNSSVFRMQDGIPLIVPEVNAHLVKNIRGGAIVANPNCSTTQAVVPLKALDKAFNLKRVIYSTYQAVSGSGKGGIDDYHNTKNGGKNEFYPHKIYNNLIPQIDVFMDNNYTKEEMKMIDETKKILERDDLSVTATCVRVPVINCHSVSINAEFEREVSRKEVLAVLKKAEGVILIDDDKNNNYPMPIDADGIDEVLVGRIRIDTSNPKAINFFCVADNLRKGAASNCIQILHMMLKK
ncbi:MAG: aspartate-semialdehyde dehydrogenase [Firmicutes bacterium]|nr:aspartate-semialdehyde dehydrogenase [Bacillota bacterium]